MADYDLTVGNAAAGRSAIGEGNLYVEEITFSAVTDPLLSTDRAKLFNIPAKYVVEHISAEIITPEGATATAEVGNGTNGDAFIDALNLNGDAGTITKNSGAADEAGIGAISADADGIYLDPAHDLDTCVVKFVAVFLDMSGLSASLI